MPHMLTAESALALFLMLAIASIAYYTASNVRQPYTVVLVIVGILLAIVSSFAPFHFLREFQLTPELLFFIFLPTLLFESAFNMNIRRIVDDWKPILILAVGGLLVSALAIGVGLWFVLGLIGLHVPFVVTLLFGALISATDPVAVLALFKEYGAPRRLTLLFEGESIANDATALALFLVVLGLVGHSLSLTSIASGGLTFITMLVGGTALGLLVGSAFIALIGLFRENEVVATTLMIVLAHLTFLIAEIANETAVAAGLSSLEFSPIIATTVASVLMGNYGRFKVTPRAEEFVEKFWEQFAFMANSIVFILVGFLAATLPAHTSTLILPAIATIFVVAAARAISVYGTLLPFNLFASDEKKVPRSWQHLLSWGSLRGALAVMLVLLIPPDLQVPGWSMSFSVQEFLLILTIACVFATLFFKATTIGPMMRRLGIDALTPMEDATETEADAIIHGATITRLKTFSEKGYILPRIAERLIASHEEQFASCSKKLRGGGITTEEYTTRALHIYLLGVEKESLKDLFAFGEMTEDVFRHIHGKLVIQAEAIERGEAPNSHTAHDGRDIFDNAVESILSLLPASSPEEKAETQILYYRAQAILAGKVLKELRVLEEEIDASVFSKESLNEARSTYDAYRTHAKEKADTIRAAFPEVSRMLGERLAGRSILRVQTKYLKRLRDRGFLTPKLFIKLTEQYEAEAQR